MLELLDHLASPNFYMPHGHCYLWQTPLVGLHMVSDGLIAIAYFSIPAMLFYFVRKRQDLPFSNIFIMFGAFITFCGVGHSLDIWTLWFPTYWVSGIERAMTALISCYTALRLRELLPQFLALKTPEQLEQVNRELQRQVAERQKTEETLRAIVVGTASVTGADFFPALAENLARCLDVSYVAVTEAHGDGDRPTPRNLVFWWRDHLVDNCEFNWEGTPCHQVLQTGRVCCYSQDLQQSFPEHPLFRELEAQSYLGIPLADGDGKTIGILSILDVKPLFQDDRAHAIVNVFATRAATELQRSWAEEEKRRAYEELEFRVEERTAALKKTNLALATEVEERIAAEAAMKLMADREKAINQVILQMRRSLNLEVIFQATADELRKVLSGDRVLIYRFHEDWSGTLVSESVADGWIPVISDVQKNEVLTQNTVDFEDCMVPKFGGSVNSIEDTYLQENRGGFYRQKYSYCCVSDVYTAGFSPCYLDLLEQLQARSYTIAPIFQESKLWGLLCVYQNGDPRHWKAAEVKAIAQIANQLGVAVRQAELFAKIQRQAEELKRTARAADAANRAKSEFLANMSHELRTPLNAILGFTQLLQRDRTLASKHREYIKIIGHSGQHLLELINDVLEMSKIEAGRIALNATQFGLRSALQAIEAMLKLKAESKGVILSFEIASEVPALVRTDENKLRQVLINLIGNAIKFTERGTVTLRVAAGEPEPPETGGRPTLTFEVRDTGCGISAAEMDELFQAFKQTRSGRESQQGSGLGLVISRRFVKLMGGEIEVSSELGRGSCFSFQIPVEIAEENPDRRPSHPGPQVTHIAPGQKEYRILVVEDNPVNRLLLTTLLRDLGLDVEEAENGREAIAAWRRWDPDLIFMDMHMPILDGFAATREIKQFRGARVPAIVAITASAFAEQKQECLEAGCDDFISKPFRREQVLDVLTRYLGVEYAESPPDTADWESDRPAPDTAAIDVAKLSVMPPEWRDRLHYAAQLGNDLTMLSLIEQIPPEQDELIRALRAIVENFQFERVIELFEPARADD